MRAVVWTVSCAVVPAVRRPGSSVFFISLEDDLMRLFGSERIAPLMDKLGLQDDEMIENSFITKRIEQAQKKVEENHFGSVNACWSMMML